MEGAPSAADEVPVDRARRTVLVVDDDSIVRAVVREILEDAGFAVLESDEPNEALSLVAETPVDLLITDIVMPTMSGFELGAAVTKARPRLRLLYTSGFLAGSLERVGFRADGGAGARRVDGLGQSAGFLLKPFTPAELVAAANQALAA
jgi:CheY-like chemotaxis protein